MMIRPFKKAGMPRIVRRVSSMGLTAVADAVLLSEIDAVSEGRIEEREDGTRVYSGSTMLRAELRDLMRREELGTQDLLRHIRASVGFRIQLMRLARREAENAAGAGFREPWKWKWISVSMKRFC
jgi:hypothetical protein